MGGECQLHNDTENKSRCPDVQMSRNISKHQDTKTSRHPDIVIGQVDFVNCFPINMPIELGEVKVNATIENGVPSELNKLILNNEIDIAPVSSITYIENKDNLIPISTLCIASDGPADSVLLFSKFPIEELDGAKIALSHASATSNKLLEIILKEFLNLKFTLELPPISNFSAKGGSASGGEFRISNYAAVLYIGDHALFEYSKMPRDIFIYDLGSLWKKYTGLPMVFGIWVIRKEIIGAGHDLPLIVDKLKQALSIGLGPMFDRVIKKAQERVLLSEEFYKTYFEHLKYEFTEECKDGLEVFERYCKKAKFVQIH